MRLGKGSLGKVSIRRTRGLREDRLAGLKRSSARAPLLIGSLCAACGSYSFPGQAVCPRCGDVDLQMVGLSRRGRLETFAIIRNANPGYGGPTPFAVGTVMLPEGVRLRALVSGCHPEELRTGMEVELDYVKSGEARPGDEVFTQAFRPV